MRSQWKGTPPLPGGHSARTCRTRSDKASRTQPARESPRRYRPTGLAPGTSGRTRLPAHRTQEEGGMHSPVVKVWPRGGWGVATVRKLLLCTPSLSMHSKHL